MRRSWLGLGHHPGGVLLALACAVFVSAAHAQVEVAMHGAIVGVTGYSGDVDPALSFRATRSGTNEGGPYQLTIYVDAFSVDAPDQLLEVSVVFLLPGDLGPGTHRLAPLQGPTGGAPVRAGVRAFAYAGVDHPDFSAASGTITIVEIGERLSATFAFEAEDDDGRRVVVEGAVSELPFLPKAESLVLLSGAVDARLTSVSAASRRGAGTYAFVFGIGSDHEVVLLFDDALGVGTYDFVPGDGTALPPGAHATIGLVGSNGAPPRGALTLTEVGPRLGGTFSVDFYGADGVVRVEGVFEAIVPAPID